jgi:hypothetical protein
VDLNLGGRRELRGHFLFLKSQCWKLVDALLSWMSTFVAMLCGGVWGWFGLWTSSDLAKRSHAFGTPPTRF